MKQYDKVLANNKKMKKIESNKDLLELYIAKNNDSMIGYFSVNSDGSPLVSILLMTLGDNNPIKKINDMQEKISDFKSKSILGKTLTGLVGLLGDDDLEADEEFKELSDVFNNFDNLSGNLENQYDKLLDRYCSIIDIVKGLCKEKSSNYSTVLREQKNIDEIIRQLHPTKKAFEEYNKDVLSLLDDLVALMPNDNKDFELIIKPVLDLLNGYLKSESDRIYN